MTELLDQAITLLQELPAEMQDSAAVAIIQQIDLFGEDEGRPEVEQD